MLDLLRAHRVAVTAFMVGTFVDAHSDVVRTAASDGHEIANHTYTHLTFASLPRPQMTNEVTRCRESLSNVVGTTGAFFRPSGTANGIDAPTDLELQVAASAGYATVLGYDVDPSDYADPGAASITQRVAQALHPGAVVSLHFGHQGTIDALPDLLRAIDERGLRPVTAGQLLTA